MVTQKTIVLIHGFGEDHFIFQHQIEKLRQSYHVFAPDLPGSGMLSNHAWSSEMESIEWFADWIKVQLELNHIDNCIMLGHSMGGYITLAFAEKYGNMLEAFGLIHSTAFADSPSKKEIREKAIVFIKEKGGHTFLKTAIPGLFGELFRKNFPDMVDELVNRARAFTSSALIGYYKAMIKRPDRTFVLKNAKIPVLIIAGTEDMAAPLIDLSAQASMPSICHFHILQDVGHMGMLEKSDGMNKILLNFMESLL
ncbi:MAG: alpha/beta hydrolase [Chitinophagaceae bacterium]|jgi:pimeloyl-ACP methyl ester carboxylesterase|nr:alpha/beta hydrolase [Chitinophagaceae bacterium]